MSRPSCCCLGVVQRPLGPIGAAAGGAAAPIAGDGRNRARAHRRAEARDSDEEAEEGQDEDDGDEAEDGSEADSYMDVDEHHPDNADADEDAGRRPWRPCWRRRHAPVVFGGRVPVPANPAVCKICADLSRARHGR